MSTLHRIIITIALLMGFGGSVATAIERTEPLPPELEGVGVTEHPNAPVPRDLTFTDETGRPVQLGDFFTGRKPVILTLNYSNCPMLCQVQLDGLVDGLKGSKWIMAKDFDIVTVSIDPLESPQRANLTKQGYIRDYGRPEAAPGWHFLVGPVANIKSLADAVGFGYKYDKEQDQYIHAAVAMICTPDGHLSRYLYGVMYEPQTLTFALLEASEGKVGSTLDQVLLFCFHYDDKSGRYALAALNLMRAGGLLTVLVLGILLSVRWRRDARRKKDVPEPAR